MKDETLKYLFGLFNMDKFSYALLGSMSSFLIPPLVMFKYLLLFIVIDLIAGIRASKKEGKEISSKNMRATASKAGSYFIVILLSHSIDLIMGNTLGFKLMNILVGFIAFIELQSVIENLYRSTENEVFYTLSQFNIKKITEFFGINPKTKGGKNEQKKVESKVVSKTKKA